MAWEVSLYTLTVLRDSDKLIKCKNSVLLTLGRNQALKSEMNIVVKQASFRSHTRGSILKKLKSPKVSIPHPRNLPSLCSLLG